MHLLSEGDDEHEKGEEEDEGRNHVRVDVERHHQLLEKPLHRSVVLNLERLVINELD